jgi:hypothetical protein
MTMQPTSHQNRLPETIEHTLPDGSIYKTFTPKDAVNLIHVWANHTWPMTKQQAFELRDALGWVPSLEDDCVFYSQVQVGERTNGYMTIDEHSQNLSTISFTLTTFASDGLEPAVEHTLEELYETCRQSLQTKYGKGRNSADDIVKSCEWRLPSKGLIYLARISRCVNIVIDAPEMNKVTEAENAYFEYFGPDAP